MQSFRKRLNSKAAPDIREATLNELEVTARHLVGLYLGKPKSLRPSAVARELKSLAKSLGRAAMAAERLGEQGMLHLLIASNANRDPEDLDPRKHIDYLVRIARWAERAAETAVEISRSEGDNKGGRRADERLRGLVVLLMDRFQELLALRPTHKVSPDTGLGESLFDIFVKSAISEFAPPGVNFKPRKIDDAICWALASRDLGLFTPPPAFFEI